MRPQLPADDRLVGSSLTVLADDADARLDGFEGRGAAYAAEVDDEGVLLDPICRRSLTRRPESDGVVEAVAQEHYALLHGARPAPANRHHDPRTQ